jgi:hypothetical protein
MEHVRSDDEQSAACAVTLAPETAETAASGTPWTDRKDATGDAFPRRKLLVLDVNGLLVHRAYKAKPKEYSRPPDAVLGEFSVFLRPHALSFVGWAMENFNVAVWCTATERNAVPLVDMLFAGESERPVVLLHGGDCRQLGIDHPDKPGKPLVCKRLADLWACAEVVSRGPYSAANTLILDDAPYKCVMNPPGTALHPREWKCEMGGKNDALDETLAPSGPMRACLETIARAPDVAAGIADLSSRGRLVVDQFIDWRTDALTMYVLECTRNPTAQVDDSPGDSIDTRRLPSTFPHTMAGT